MYLNPLFQERYNELPQVEHPSVSIHDIQDQSDDDEWTHDVEGE